MIWPSIFKFTFSRLAKLAKTKYLSKIFFNNSFFYTKFILSASYRCLNFLLLKWVFHFMWSFQLMKTVVQGFIETGMQQMAVEVAERTVVNTTKMAINGKKVA